VLVALKEMGDRLRENDKTGLDYFLTLDKLSNTDKIICIDFAWDGEKAAYSRVHTEHSGNMERTLYSGGTSRGGDYSPTSIITFNAPEKALARMWEYGWFAKYEGEDPLVNSLKEAYRVEKEKIDSEVIEAYGRLDRKERRSCLLTINIIENGEERYIDSYPVFREDIKKNVVKSWVRTYNTESSGTGECSICKNEGELFGFAFPFTFRSFDKLGFAPELMVENAWKQLPTCYECAYSMRAAQSFLDENSFGTRLGDVNYYIVPEFPVSSPPDDVMETILEGKKKESELSFISAEEYYTELILGHENIAMNLIFLFYTRNQSQQRIEKYIEDVSPSWIRKLYKVKKEVEGLSVFREESIMKTVKKDQEGGWKFRTLDGIIFSVLPDSKEVYNFKDLALYLMGCVLRGERVNKDLLFDMYAKEIRRRFLAELKGEAKFYDLPSVYSLNSFMFNLFLLQSGSLESEKMSIEIELGLNERQQQFEEFFKEYGKAFEAPEKRAVFLEGVLAKYLMNVQYARRGSTPFRSKLSGLNLDSSKMQKLLSEIDDKLAAYEVGYTSLRELTSIYMLKAEKNGWAISRDEITYYFTLGMNLAGIFKKEREKDE